ncbi:winged helix-turn-helix transcriptional regulator [Glycomyces harbinensis]|uniref:Transcriptional regulator, HxlR family n=1 Tax=Glycomyces harbinensis TaxID=58114 RepID=A0A1G7AU31_9ACTN|nr:helix-turn-helix domain-containing protein [Glycomyces harbinensis]SDE18291.1 transcriptional regulator, HxlR family [Glycomyces harbinensis]
MALGKDYLGQDCSLSRALELLGERWTLLVVQNALYGVRRFSDFQVRLDIPRAVLSDRLSRLTGAGVLEKRLYQPSPPRHEYLLTDSGVELWPVIFSLGMWGRRHIGGESARLFRHADCGAKLLPSTDCSECGPIAPGDVEMYPGPGPKRDDPVSRAMNRPRRLLEPVVPEPS